MKRKKTVKKKKTASALKPKPKPYTIQQEQDTVIGKIIYWTFLIGFIPCMIIGFSIARNNSFKLHAVPLVLGGWSLSFGLYVLIGFWLKLDHARVAAAEHCKEYKYVLNREWGKKDRLSAWKRVLCALFLAFC